MSVLRLISRAGAPTSLTPPPPAQVNGEETGETLSAYCSSPEAVFGAAFLAVLPSHRLLHGSSCARDTLHRSYQSGRGEVSLFGGRGRRFFGFWIFLITIYCRGTVAQ